MSPTEQRFDPVPPSPRAFRVAAAPFQFVSTGEDSLRITSVSSLVNAHVKIQARRSLPDGSITADVWDHTPNSNRTAKTDDFSIAPGAILNLVAFESSGTGAYGQVWVTVQLIRGAGAAAVVLGILVEGYITQAQPVAWPGSPLMTSFEGPGLLREVASAAPAVGVNPVLLVPSGARWELMTATVQLVTSVAGGNRQAVMNLDNGIIPLAISVNPGLQGPSTTQNWFWTQGLTLSALISLGANVAGLPLSYRMLPGNRIRLTTSGLDAADAYTIITAIVREWLVVP